MKDRPRCGLSKMSSKEISRKKSLFHNMASDSLRLPERDVDRPVFTIPNVLRKFDNVNVTYLLVSKTNMIYYPKKLQFGKKCIRYLMSYLDTWNRFFSCWVHVSSLKEFISLREVKEMGVRSTNMTRTRTAHHARRRLGKQKRHNLGEPVISQVILERRHLFCN